ncbi:DNA-binding protein [candidate division WOR-3 bacterium]|nr:DNA-binding protein [candidate division WOR-3 bacterium]
MQSKQANNLIFIRLFPDENIHEKLEEACRKYEVTTAVVISGIGQLKDFKLGYFKEKGNYTQENFETPHELLSLAGNICKQKDEYAFHLHAVLGNEKKEVVGGHLIEGLVEVTNEIILLKNALQIKRKLEKDTGLEGMFL